MAIGKKIGKDDVQDVMALTPMQAGILFHYLAEPESEQYFEQVHLQVSGNIELDLFEKAWNRLIETNEMLRTFYRWENIDQPVQIVLKKHEVDFRFYDLTLVSSQDQDQALRELHEKDRNEKFDLQSVPFRVTLCKLDQKYEIILSNHHILYDGWSNGVLLKEFIGLYNQLVKGEMISEPRKTSFKEFIKWFKRQDVKRQEEYWKEYLSGFDQKTELPYDFHKQDSIIRGKQYLYTLSSARLSRLQRITQNEKVTLASVLYTAWGILLHRYCTTDDLVFGTTVSGRTAPIPKIENMVGLFINTLPLRIKIDPKQSVKELVHQVNQMLENRVEYEHTSLIDIKSYSEIDQQESLFDSLIVMENYPLDLTLKGEGDQLKIESYSIMEMTNYDLTCAITTSDQLTFQVVYNQDLFEEKTIEQMWRHLDKILFHLVENFENSLAELKMLTEEEKQQLLFDFNQTESEFPKEKMLHQLFEEQVKGLEDEIALRHEDIDLTYRELNERANQLARVLRQKGVRPEVVVGVIATRPDQMVLGQLAVMKAGGAFLALDPEFPPERIDYMLMDSNAQLLLEFGLEFTQFNGERINLAETSLYQGDGTDLEPVNKATDLVYLVYTSGSTGKPKGVLIEHRSIVNQIYGLQEMYGFDSTYRHILLAPFTFDPSVQQVFLPLVSGGRLLLVSNELKMDTLKLVDYIVAEGINIINTVPSFMSLLIDQLDHLDEKLPLEFVILAGEVFTKKLYSRIRDSLNVKRTINIYGPSEATINTTLYECANSEVRKTIPIGKPLMNYKVFVLDQHHQLVPVGVPGELCIAGIGLARGYLNRPEETQERFIANPFWPGERLYKTGDLVKWHRDGNLEFVGRVDNQIKIRGMRIELDEIEQFLIEHEKIKEAVVLKRVDPTENTYLSAYLVCTEEVQVEEVRVFLAERVPDYMIPAQYLFLDQLPLNTSDKVDKKALLQLEGITRTEDFVEPVTEVERQLVEIWKKALGVEKVGLRDNFFYLGGDSIKAIQVVSKAKRDGILMTVKDIFTYQTIQRILKNVDYQQESWQISQDEVVGEVLLTPIQRWFFEQGFAKEHYWNQTYLFELQEVDLAVLEQAINKLIEHHDTLRMGYQLSEEAIQQFVRPTAEVTFALKQVDLTSFPLQEQEDTLRKFGEELQDQLNLEKDLLFTGTVFTMAQNQRYLLLAVHHLIIDGISWRILLEDLENAYWQLKENRTPCQLPAKTTSFQEWSHKLCEHVAQNPIDVEYWENIDLRNQKSLASKNFKGNYYGDQMLHELNLDQDLTSKLLKNVNAAYNTEINDILLTSLLLTLSDLLDTEHLLFSLEGHGREEIIPNVDLSRTIGWFTSLYPVCLERKGDLSQNIIHVKENLRRIPNKGLNYGLYRYLKAGVAKEKLAQLTPEISFNYLGEFTDVFGGGQTGLLSLDNPVFEGSMSRENENPFLLTINAGIFAHQLKFVLVYNGQAISQETILGIGTGLQENLVQIIEHCTNKDKTTFTVSDFDLQGEILQQDLDHLIESLDLTQVSHFYPLTPLQKGLMIHSLAEVESRVYHEQTCFYLNQGIDLANFKEAWQRLINRYDIFRTHFKYNGMKNPLQVVFHQQEAEIYEYDYSAASPEEQTEWIGDFKAQDLTREFDFEEGRLNRLTIIQLGNDRYFVCWSFHHILLDGWSSAKVIGEFFQIYQRLLTNARELEAPKAEFKDYVYWLNRQNQNDGLQFWKEYLGDYIGIAKLPIQQVADDSVLRTLEERKISFSSAEKVKIEQFCREHFITVNTLFQTVWGLLLQRYSNSNDICFGMTVSGRSMSEVDKIEEIVGLMINTLPVRIKTEQDTKVNDLLQKVNENLAKINECEYSSLVDIKRVSGVDPSIDLFNTITVFENYPLDAAMERYQLELGIEVDSVFEFTNYDIAIQFMNQKEMEVKFSFNSTRIADFTARNIVSHFSHLLLDLMDHPERRVHQLEMLSTEEKEQLIWQVNQTEVAYPAMTIPDIFAEQVRRNPERTAVVFECTELTYQQLDEQANQLAHYLIDQGHIIPDRPIALCLERSTDMVVAILGVLKAGGAYLPIEPQIPEERMKMILDDAQVSLIISTKSQIRLLNRLQWECENLITYLCLNSENVYAEEEAEQNQLMNKHLWEYIGEQATDEIEGGGWVNSYTGENFTSLEMEEYAENVLKKVTPYLTSESRILEIGCASGITMFNLAPSVGFYYGTDLSETIIQKNQERVQVEQLENIKLAALPGHEIDTIGEGDFDIVIINSVIQCFHGHNYLRQVIAKVIDLLADQGIVFIGDVMDQDLKMDLVQSMIAFKESHLESEHNYTTKTDWTQELFVARGFFKDLQVEMPAVKEVHFSRKIHTVENELTRFRYDTVIQIDKTQPSQVDRVKHKHQHDSSMLKRYAGARNISRAKPEEMAYVIYTSGTTGRPKGVAVEHRNIMNTLFWRTDYYSISEQDAILQFASYSFDSSVEDIFTPLLRGGKLVLIDQDRRLDSGYLADCILREKITHLLVVPSLYKVLLNEISQVLQNLRFITLAGEKVPESLVEKHYQILPDVELYNEYGPTENAVCSTVYKFTRENPQVLIGQPISNNQCYILDLHGNLQPFEVAGQLCLSGNGVARGYLGRPELTAEKFVPHPFSVGQRMYLTGDLCRRLADGQLEFLGRVDHQVKVRGYRIELEEIEKQLLASHKIEEAVVVVQTDENEHQYLCAFVVPHGELDLSELKKGLVERLPEYMLPTQFVTLDSLPLTPNGKIDRKSLGQYQKNVDQKYQAPETELEAQIVEIWKEVLGVEQVGITTSFFDLGGNSLKIMELYSKLKNQLSEKINVVDLFSYHTIVSFVEFLEEQQVEVEPEPVMTEDEELLAMIKNLKSGQLSVVDAEKKI